MSLESDFNVLFTIEGVLAFPFSLLAIYRKTLFLAHLRCKIEG